MKGTYEITRTQLKDQYGACEDGMAFFDATFPDGKAGYQDMLDKAVAAGHTDYAEWLLNKVGPTEDVLELESVDDEKLDIVFAGHIKFKFGAILHRLISGWSINAGRSINAGGSIDAGGAINAGWSIDAGCSIDAGGYIDAGGSINAGKSIKAGESIKAGGSINAGGAIKAGRKYGIYAGLGAPLSSPKDRKITATNKPENIVCGEWEEREQTDG